MDTSEPEPEIGVTAVNEELKKLIKHRDKSYREIQNYLKELGYEDENSPGLRFTFQIFNLTTHCVIN